MSELIASFPDEACLAATRLAADLFDAPMAAVSLVDGDMVWSKAAIGCGVGSTSMAQTICSHAIRGGPEHVLYVPDARSDPRFRDLPSVVAGTVRFYIGAVLSTEAGEILGVLCVTSPEPRDPRPRDAERLTALARMVVSVIRLRWTTRVSEQARRLLEMGETVAGLGHWRLDARTHEVSWSDEVYRIHGLDRASFNPNHESAVRLYVDEDAPLMKAHVDRAIREKSPLAFELRVKRPDGQIRHVLSRAVCEFDDSGAVTGLFGVFQDQTDRVEREQSIRASEERYRLLTEKSIDIIARMSLDVRPTFVSPSVTAVLGYHPDDMKERSILDLVHAEDRARVEMAFQQMVRSSAPRLHSPLDYRVRHRDGGWIWLESRPTLLFDPQSGAPSEFVDTIRDVTQRKAYEVQLSQAREAAEAASRSKSEFLANMSHELRTPLNSIIGFTSVLQAESGFDASQRRRLKIVEDAGRNLLCVVNDVLDFSRIEAGRVDLKLRPFAPVQLVADAVTLLRSQAAEKGLSLQVDLPVARRYAVIGDPDRLRQVLINLLSNAVKFTDVGGVTLKLEAWESGSELAVKISVADSGIGMSADQLAVLFERFSQVDASGSRRFGGSGLGLAISKRLIEAMNGRLEVESELGVGSTFTLRLSLPLSVVAASTSPATSRASGRSLVADLAGKRLLVAEDVEVNQELVRLILEPTGCSLDLVSTGAEAYAKASTFDYDAVFMDLQMPEMDGLEATRKIRALPGSRGRVPVIALTANVLPEQVARCRAAGMIDHIGKPFASDDLLETVIRWTCKPEARDPVDQGRLSALETQLGHDAVAKLMMMFQRQLVRFCELPTAGPDAAVRAGAHALKGTAGTLGFSELTHLANELERTSPGDADAVREPHQRVRAACAGIIAFIDGRVRGSAAQMLH